jgi:hypothetical protein
MLLLCFGELVICCFYVLYFFKDVSDLLVLLCVGDFLLWVICWFCYVLVIFCYGWFIGVVVYW